MTQVSGESRILLRRTAIVLCMALAGLVGLAMHLTCSKLPLYSPASFRSDLQALVGAQEFASAARYLRLADPETQAAYDKAGYIAIGEDAIILPGVSNGTTTFHSERDWLLPGTSDAVEDVDWQTAAASFAEAYNRFRN